MMIPAENAHLKIAAATDPGKKGKNNEDHFSVAAYTLGSSDHTPAVFAIVADGIGGHRAGEVASSIAVEMICDAVASSDASDPLGIMESAILNASQAIQAQGSNSDSQFGMGTTAVCTWVIGDRLYATHVGNSRLYLLRRRRMIQLNVDHTWVREAVDAGALTTDQARNHPHANIIRRYLGSEVNPQVDMRIRTDRNHNYTIENQGFRLRPGDRLLLCSDGLNDMVVDPQISSILGSGEINQAAHDLIDEANAAGGKDNVTAVILEVPEKEGIGGVWDHLQELTPQLAVAYAGLILMGLAILTALGMFFYQLFAR